MTSGILGHMVGELAVPCTDREGVRKGRLGGKHGVLFHTTVGGTAQQVRGLEAQGIQMQGAQKPSSTADGRLTVTLW